MSKKYKNLESFYAYYLTEHENLWNKRLHFIGTSISMTLFIYSLLSFKLYLIPLCFICAYGFAWTGHFFIEKNKPATFQYPLYSFLSDFIMFYQILTGKISIRK